MNAEPKLAGRVVPYPIEARYGKTESGSDGLAAEMAAYHAARAQGFYLATMAGDINPTIVTNMINEFHLAYLYYAMACTDEISPDSIAADVGVLLQHHPESIGYGIYEILEWANIDPKSIAPFKATR